MRISDWSSDVCSSDLAAGTVAVAVLVGGLLLLALSRFSLERFTTAEGLDRIGHRIWLLVAAITLHNAPEGLAVGVSFARDAGGEGYATALGIGIDRKSTRLNSSH